MKEVFVTKLKGLDVEGESLKSSLKENFNIETGNVRVFNRYIVKDINEREFKESIYKVFAEKNADLTYLSFDDLKIENSYLITELLPGQFDIRSQAAMDCLSLLWGNFNFRVKVQKIYDFDIKLGEDDFEKVKNYLINKVEMREGSLNTESLFDEDLGEIPYPEVYESFRFFDENALRTFHKEMALAMTYEDLLTVKDYFIKENRDPNETEIKVLDTYWSDHCRHTTFNTLLTDVKIENEEIKKAYEDYLNLRKELGREDKAVSLMDIATIGARYLKKKGIVKDIDESDEINACSIIREIRPDSFYGGEKTKYLIQFKNETHNHPTEIEPFGGAATCLGGAIRDPLSGRAFVYQAMRVTGSSDPREKIEETLEGKLAQKLITTGAAKGYSSYGNQIGLAAGVVHEIYHPGYKAKRMEVGAVIGSSPYDKVMRLKPVKGDLILLIGGRTGRDGVGGATGSSKSHDTKSIDRSGAEVQKGNAPEERKIQRFMRREEVKVLIKKCNDFGAGGVSVAVGELADGLHINLDRVPLKYQGLNATETAISESQERMALLIDKSSLEEIGRYLKEENLEYTVIAEVTDDNKLTMVWKGQRVLELKRDFLDSAGAKSYQRVLVKAKDEMVETDGGKDEGDLLNLLGDLNIASQRALNENFDSTNGCATKLLPFGGLYQDSESQVMACHIPLTKGISQDISLMSYGFDPYLSERDQFKGAYMAVIESLSKMAAAGSNLKGVRLSFQEYFEKLGKDEVKWGKPLSSLLGALKAQIDYEVPAIGGKDSMSGTFNDISVPPTLISFAVDTMEGEKVITNVFNGPSDLYLLKTSYLNGLPVKEDYLKKVSLINKLNNEGKIKAADLVNQPLLACLYRMGVGNRTSFDVNVKNEYLGKDVASFIISVEKGTKVDGGIYLGSTTNNREITFKINGKDYDYVETLSKYKESFSKVFNENCEEKFKTNKDKRRKVTNISYIDRSPVIYLGEKVKPRVLIPVFPGSNCEYDLERAFNKAGADVKIFVLRNKDKENLKESLEEFNKEMKKSQILMLPGGFSAGDEPDGSGKYIGNVLRNEVIKKSIEDLVDVRKGLVLGICNGFQALIKLGLVPYGKIMEPNEDMPLLTNNTIGKHMDMIARVRVASVNSPWLKYVNVGESYSVPISHGEGRFLAKDEVLRELIENGQIITQYCDLNNNATMEAPYNPNGSVMAVEGLVSKDGRILGKMGHNERWCKGLFKNYDDEFDMKLFKAGVDYFL